MRRHTVAVAFALVCASASGAVAISASPAVAGRPLGAGTSTNSSLTSVSCASAAACAAVGFDTIAGVSEPFAASWNGKTWTAQATPVPKGFKHGVLSAVSCRSATNCTAVGAFDNAAGAEMLLAEHWNGKVWAVEVTPAPANYYGQSLVGVSCPSTSACIAVGSYFQLSGIQLTLADYWNGRTWTIQATPAGGPKYLVSVSCTSTSACTAVGSYAKNGGAELTLVEHWNGKAWAVVSAPHPTGSQGTYPAMVACATATSCMDVGYYQNSTSSFALAESWNGTAWRVLATPRPASGTNEFLAGTACPAATTCFGVGYAQNGGSSSSPLAERWSGKVWTVQPMPWPKGGSALSLFGVGCSTTTACTAVGSYQKGSDTLTLAERWNGKAWAVEATPNS